MDILIIEGRESTRRKLVRLLHGRSDYSIADVGSAEEALALIKIKKPGVIIHSLKLPGLSGAAAVAALKTCCPAAEILVLTTVDENERAIAALKAGASGCIHRKTAGPDQLADAVEELRVGGAPMTHAIARRILMEFQTLSTRWELQDGCSPLSRRETEILEKLYRGKSYRQIAGELYISLETVNSHIKNIYEKLNVNSRAQAVYEACVRKLLVQ